MKLSIFIISLLGFFWSLHAQAAFFVEPIGGYVVSGSVESDVFTCGSCTGNPFDGDQAGMGYGLRIGYNFPSMFLSASYYQYDTTIEEAYGAGSNDVDALTTLATVSLGFFFYNRMRFWVGYSPQAQTEYFGTGITNPPTIRGTGIHAGIGYNWFRHLAVNLEYYGNDFSDEVDFADGFSTTQDPAGTNKDSAIFLTLSFPFGY